MRQFQQTKCNICKIDSNYFSNVKILNKYEISYYKCINCGFVQTENPYWLNEVYSNAITNSDLGIVNRNIIYSNISKAIIFALFDRKAIFLDYGGGYGLFVRMMRDLGLNFFLYDKYCRNIFAKGFEADINTEIQYDLITAFEVFEHLVDPIEEIRNIIKYSKSILFSTELLPTNNPKPGEWWYYGIEHGQHISFYTLKALSTIANNFNLNFYSNGISLHLFTQNKLSPLLFNLLSRYKVAQIINILIKEKSLLDNDYQKLCKQLQQVT